MNQLCRVCGEPAAGFHFGAFTCEGCKSFFGRTYNNLGSISECKNNGECVINKKNRTSCKACRLRKCLLVGMSKSGSRYGRRSNWFKIHCLLQEQQQSQHSGGKPGKVWDGIPYQTKTYLEDNNNAPPKDGKERPVSPVLMSPPGQSWRPDAAAAIWAARSALVPMHPGLPFFTPSFMHNSHFHHQPPPSPNFLFPFMPPRHPPPELPMVSNSSSSSSSSTPDVQNTADKSTTTEVFSYDKCLSVLRSLGPVQETPMDLSFNPKECSRDTLIANSPELGEESCDNQERTEKNGEEEEIDLENAEKDEKSEKKSVTTPLDLTCTKS